ncbi:hypothetical protein [Scytonema millei]|uniref:Uncharacterized protein n=1 Tax=Scytonema millei VB511283 TaxID=1245923 RepID=A0A9X5I824_9CYAN|nr:hypothetical protein [Scytonema millei]NHC38280.1 hypothetical protein [Scytonema millei VB511283]
MNWQLEESELQQIAIIVLSLADKCRGDNLALLALLRQLEQLHREIRDGLFQESLPDNRQALYALLKDIETTGGWPYIERLRIQQLLANWQLEEDKGDNISV